MRPFLQQPFSPPLIMMMMTRNLTSKAVPSSTKSAFSSRIDKTKQKQKKTRMQDQQNLGLTGRDFNNDFKGIDWSKLETVPMIKVKKLSRKKGVDASVVKNIDKEIPATLNADDTNRKSPPSPTTTITTNTATTTESPTTLRVPALQIPVKQRVRSDDIPPPNPALWYDTIIDPARIASPADAMSLTVAVMGPANAGKSTLLNQILGHKVSIATAKPQTTRTETLGVWTFRNFQIEFVDTPGVSTKAYESKIERSIIKSYMNTAQKVEHVLWVVDGANFSRTNPLALFNQKTLDNMGLQDVPVTLVLNKMDLPQFRKKVPSSSTPILNMDRISDISEAITQAIPSISRLVWVSAQTRENLSELKSILMEHALPGIWKYPPGLVTNESILMRAQEIIREKFYQRFSKEVPYNCEIGISGLKIHHATESKAESIADFEGKFIEIRACIKCPRPAYVKYVGKPDNLMYLQYHSEMDLKHLLKASRVDLNFDLICDKKMVKYK